MAYYQVNHDLKMALDTPNTVAMLVQMLYKMKIYNIVKLIKYIRIIE